MNIRLLILSVFVLLLNCVPVKNLYNEKIVKQSLSISDKNKIKLNGYYFSWKQV